ncbi:MAG TPA: extracellular solute-binding protein [Bauldia sp.]|nr:extracellular solute-binding protein [Bauldia sp.]
MTKHIAALSASLLALGLCGQLAISTARADEITIHAWAWADRSGPMRATNLINAADLMNKEYKAEGIDRTIKVDMYNDNVDGFDTDARNLLKAFAVGKGPDVFPMAHEWLGEFASDGYVMDMEPFINQFPEYFSDVVPVLWDATKYKGDRYAIPQDTEIRMFFYNKDMLRKIGKDEAFINGLPAMVDSGQFTMDDMTALAKEVVDKGAAKYGIVHRPNSGPDYLMTFSAFGVKFINADGKLLLTKKEMKDALTWFANNVKEGVTPANLTSMTFDSIQQSFKQEQTFIYHHGVWTTAQFQLGDAMGATWPTDEAGYFHKIGWLNAPSAVKGGKPTNLSHPIVYAVNPKGEHPDIAAMLVAYATQPYFNVQHAVTSAHMAITNAETGMPQYKAQWALADAVPMLQYTSFIPNHPKFGIYNGILFQALQGVETGRLTPDSAIDFLSQELSNQLGDDVVIADSATQ